MTSAAYRSAGTGGRHADRRGYGLVVLSLWGLCAYGSSQNIEAAA
jgi:hypothetical protein